MLPSPFVFSTETQQNRSFTQDVIPFLNNLIIQYTNPLPFETEPHTIHTIPVAREHCDISITFDIKQLKEHHRKNLFKLFLTQSKEYTQVHTIEQFIHRTSHSLSKMFSLLICKNLLNLTKIKKHHYIFLLI